MVPFTFQSVRGRIQAEFDNLGFLEMPFDYGARWTLAAGRGPTESQVENGHSTRWSCGSLHLVS